MTPQEETVILEAREILRSYLKYNHRSGDPNPSEADLSMTREIQKGCKYLGQTLHDHIIVGAGSEVSLRALGKI